MNAKSEVQGSRGDTAKLAAALLLLIGGAVAFHYYEDQSLLLRVIGLLAVVGVALAIGLQTELGRTATHFVKDARTEVRKVVWPTWPETWQTTLAVAGMVLVVAIILWIMDSILLYLVKLLMGQGD